MRRLLWLLVLAGLAGCGGSAATATIDVAPTQTRAAEVAQLATQTRLAELAQLATLAAPTATPSPTATLAPTATPVPTATPFLTATPTRLPSPTVPRAPPTSTPLPSDVPPASYVADFSTWYAGEQAERFRASPDPATGEYRLTALRSDSIQIVSAPEDQTFSDFTLEVEARRIAGPDTGGYGLAFLLQPREPEARSAAHYFFLITPQGAFRLDLRNGDGSLLRIQPLVFSGAIRRGDAANRLTVICRGETITLAVNGRKLGTYPATLVAPGGIGVAVGMPPNNQEMEAAFSNLRLFPPESTPPLDRLARRSPNDP